MWPFSSKTTLQHLGALKGFADHNSHILPGVDDGMRTMADAIAALRAYESEGVEEVWLTPHIMEDYPSTTDDLRRKFDELSDTYRANCGARPLKLHLGAEHMLDSLFIKRFAARDLLTLDDEGSLLVETSYFSAPADLYGILADIQDAGYTPVLAHPERYMYMRDDDYERLHESGVLFQLNIVAVAGAYGREAAARAEKLLNAGYYAMAGSDIHSLRSLKAAINAPVKSSTARKVIELINQQNTNI